MSKVIELHPGSPRAPRTISRPPDWSHPSTASASAAEASPGAPAFVFHDAAGRRWPRIKRMVLLVGAVLVAVAGAVLLAVAHVAPGRAPFLPGSLAGPQQVLDWPVRTSDGTSSSSSGARPPARMAVAPAQAKSSATSVLSPSPSARPSPSPSVRPTPNRGRNRQPGRPLF